MRRGFTLVEMLVAMAVMGIVMTFAALEFRYVVYAHLFADSHLTAEQQARVAMAKIGNVARQASVVDSSPVPGVTPTPAIIEPVSTPGPRLVFTQAATLDPTVMPTTPAGVPAPCYNKVQVYLDKQAGVPEGRLYEQADPITSPCQGFDYTRMPLLLARNVEDFQVQPVANHVDIFATGYRIDLTIYDFEGHQINTQAGATYHLSSVISPNVFGQAQ